MLLATTTESSQRAVIKWAALALVHKRTSTSLPLLSSKGPLADLNRSLALGRLWAQATLLFTSARMQSFPS
jgi:hypothetical protein